ncbi:MAG: hypothetical protein PHE25_02875 [Candidatus Gracilibacteria bacterium]|nr:hypothetical protein [Candidatus Gracilibacteria bacterium]
MVNIDIEAFKKAGFTYEEIQDIIASEKDFEETGIAYDLDEAFCIIRNNLFSDNNKKCIK